MAAVLPEGSIKAEVVEVGESIVRKCDAPDTKQSKTWL